MRIRDQNPSQIPITSWVQNTILDSRPNNNFHLPDSISNSQISVRLNPSLNTTNVIGKKLLLKTVLKNLLKFQTPTGNLNNAKLMRNLHSSSNSKFHLLPTWINKISDKFKMISTPISKGHYLSGKRHLVARIINKFYRVHKNLWIS